MSKNNYAITKGFENSDLDSKGSVTVRIFISEQKNV